MPVRGDDVYAIALPRFTLSVALDTQGSGNALGETHKTPKAQQLAATNPPDSSMVDRVAEKGGYILTLNKEMFVWLTASDKSIAQWLARFVRDPEVYITVSFSDLRRGVAQWLARFVRDEEAGGSSPLTPTIF